MDILLQMPWFQVATFASGWTAVGVVAYLLITGKGGIALRREVDIWKTIAETYKTAWETSETSKAVLGDQVGELNTQVAGHTVYLQTADKVLRALDENRMQSEMRDRLKAEAERD